MENARSENMGVRKFGSRGAKRRARALDLRAAKQIPKPSTGEVYARSLEEDLRQLRDDHHVTLIENGRKNHSVRYMFAY